VAFLAREGVEDHRMFRRMNFEPFSLIGLLMMIG